MVEKEAETQRKWFWFVTSVNTEVKVQRKLKDHNPVGFQHIQDGERGG
jgi:hypothetical protein